MNKCQSILNYLIQFSLRLGSKKRDLFNMQEAYAKAAPLTYGSTVVDLI